MNTKNATNATTVPVGLLEQLMTVQKFLVSKMRTLPIILILLLLAGCSVNRTHIQKELYTCDEFIYLIEAIDDSEIILIGQPYHTPWSTDGKVYLCLFKVCEILYSSEQLVFHNLISSGEEVPEKKGIRVYYYLEHEDVQLEFQKERISTKNEFIIFIDFDKQPNVEVPVPVPYRRNRLFHPSSGELKERIYFAYSEMGKNIRKIQISNSETNALVKAMIEKKGKNLEK